jgi:hypothetical protein
MKILRGTLEPIGSTSHAATISSFSLPGTPRFIKVWISVIVVAALRDLIAIFGSGFLTGSNARAITLSP